jgi:hypothetical protein
MFTELLEEKTYLNANVLKAGAFLAASLMFLILVVLKLFVVT